VFEMGIVIVIVVGKAVEGDQVCDHALFVYTP
jgi:hypothetical protein